MEKFSEMKNRIKILLCINFFLFLILSHFTAFDPGIKITDNFIKLSVHTLGLIPCIFILIGLFDAWIKKETIQKHMGKDSGIRGYFWAIVLASTAIGGIYTALPLSYTLHKKGAGLPVLFTYLGAAMICRIPMTMFEAVFVGVQFTAIRLFVSLPIVIITSVITGNFLSKRNFVIKGE